MIKFERNAGDIVAPPTGYGEMQEWAAKNVHVRGMHEIAIEDYIAGRNTVLSLGLFTVGFALAAQAIEKLLKCHLMLAGAELADMKKHSHKLESLLHDAASKSTALQVRQAEFSAFSIRLQAWYQSRYPSALGAASEWMRGDIAYVDEMVVYLEENMPLPAFGMPLIYAGGEQGTQWNSIFVRLFNATSSQHRLAILFENTMLATRESELLGKFYEARKAFLLPAQTMQEFSTSHKKLKQELEEISTKSGILGHE